MPTESREAFRETFFLPTESREAIRGTCYWQGVPKAQTSSAQGETLGTRDGDNTQIIPEP